MPPFANRYTRRRVAGKDSQPCMICYKPSSTVLITSENADFFYVCDIHLEDTKFATPIRTAEYNDKLQHKVKLDLELRKLKLKWEEKNRYKNWDSFVSYVVKKKEDTGEEPEDLGKAIAEKEAEIAETERTLAQPAKEYLLADIFYKQRVTKRTQRDAAIRAAEEKKRAHEASMTETSVEDLEARFAFPTAPKGGF